MYDMTINADVTMAGEGGQSLLANRYHVIKQLGQGGMGSVWLAEDTVLDNRKVAIKMLPSILVANKRAYAQVKKEALVSLKLVHSNIVPVRSFEEDERGNPFLVMDYVDGQTLDDVLAEKGKLSEEEMLQLMKPIAAALDYAHREGVVHRDVKPGNVLIRKDGTPYILDFGIAREVQETMTRVTGKLSSGTLMYMSPEQLNGDAPNPAQDIYSFAAMIYECLTGHPPFLRGAIEDQIKNKQPEPLGPHFINCGPTMAGLAKDPAARPETCGDVIGGQGGGKDQPWLAWRQSDSHHSEDSRAKSLEPEIPKPMTFWRGWFTRKGRASRSEMWKKFLVLTPLWLFLYFAVFVAIDTYPRALYSDDFKISCAILDVGCPILFLLTFCTHLRRLHDFNLSGWRWGGFHIVVTTVLGIPLGCLLLPRYYFARGTVGSNDYGPDPICCSRK